LINFDFTYEMADLAISIFITKIITDNYSKDIYNK